MLALALAMACGDAQAQPPRPSVITNPDWMHKPDGQDFEDAYPPAAQMLGLDGRTVVSCQISAEGVAEGCVVIAESPKGLGFDRAALQISRTFRFKPMTRDGQPVDGGTVRVPLVFRFPADDDLTLARGYAPPASSERRLVLAHSLMEQYGQMAFLVGGLNRVFATNAAEDRAKAPPGPDHDIVVEAMLDLETALEARTPAIIEDMIAEIAAAQDEAALAQAVSDRSKRDELLRGYFEEFGNNTYPKYLTAELARARDLAREAFCARRSCSVEGRP